MADEADFAARQEELALNISRSIRKPVGPEATGFCLHCGEDLSEGKRWCDTDCRDQWQKRKDRGLV